MTYKPIIEKEHPLIAETKKYFPSKKVSGVQKIYRFDNNYGASVVRFIIDPFLGGSYGAKEGLWELAVLYFTGPDPERDYDITYSTEITNDVLGYLSDEEVEECLANIEKL